MLGQGDPVPDRLRQVLQDVCSVAVAHDGLVFLADSIQAEQIEMDDECQRIWGHRDEPLGNACLPLQTDIGCRDAITSGPSRCMPPNATGRNA